MQEADREESLLVEEPWRTQLEYLELTLSEVSKAIGALRDTLERGEAETPAPLPVHVVGNEEADTQSTAADRATKAVGAVKQTAGAAEEAEDAPPPSDFKNVWERLQRVRKERSGDEAAEPPADADDVLEAVADGGAVDDDTSIEAISANEPEAAAPDRAGRDSRPGNFQNVWERLQREREERSAAPMEEVADVRGLSNLPQSYRITIEDRDGTPVDLVPVHRALLSFAPADDVSLVNFANGTAIISLRTTEKLDLDELSSVISAATSRECEVIEQAQGKLFLRLSVEEDAEQASDG